MTTSKPVLEDCSICLDPMTQADVDHPLQCSSAPLCGFNFCRNCIESLITSSKDDYVEASDGSRQVKVHLHCPNCRSDLSRSIRDTVLLRKVDDAKAAAGVWGGEDGGEEPNMTESQRRTLKAFKSSAQVQQAVDEARRGERLFLRSVEEREVLRSSDDENPFREEEGLEKKIGSHKHLATDEEKKDMDASDYSDYVEEWGFEADLEGVHGSFRMPRPPKRLQEEQPVRMARVDSTLFAGLGYFMDQGEKLYVTELMTSGDVDQLAEAAEVMNKIAARTATPKTRPGRGSNKISSTPNRKRYSRCASIFQLIEESKVAQKKEDEKLKMVTQAIAKGRPHQRQVQAWRKSAQRRANQPPLPVRMPKSIQIHVTSKHHGLALCDDVWDGTVMDAYSKITISHSPFGGKTSIHKKKQDNHPGVRSVMGQDGDVPIELPGQKRVLVSDLGPEAGAQGVMKGDVVTHINGAHVHAKSASEVNEFFDFLESDDSFEDDIVTVVFNAEPSVAEALKRRSYLVEPET
uniref:RING-type domain-containing protein n=1 Tax=Grammatophora oceanica TaxID=210454 RepID=A0A7S1UP30_9STRA|mmetsp:Transcript_14518/g.21367  ORF Transcript_14518/g.21367 Transcript_14518/m.21367 type:complete len:519 (+) Transcript_14518:363-1919(+)